MKCPRCGIPMSLVQVLSHDLETVAWYWRCGRCGHEDHDQERREWEEEP